MVDAIEKWAPPVLAVSTGFLAVAGIIDGDPAWRVILSALFAVYFGRLAWQEWRQRRRE